MKLNIEIDCSPEEARQFFGLPAVSGVQNQMMDLMQAKMEESLQNMDAESFMQTWMPMTIKGWADVQKSFMAQMNTMRPDVPEPKDK